MGNEMQTGAVRGLPWRVLGWGLLGSLLLLPAIAMQFTTEVDWDETDFIVMGVMLTSVGLGAEFLMRRSGSIAYRMGAVIALVLGFLLVWINLAVGIIGSENNPLNLLFVTVIAVAIAGSAVARFEPAGMARAMTATSVVQALIGVVAVFADSRAVVLSGIFAACWLLSAALFRRAAQDHP